MDDLLKILEDMEIVENFYNIESGNTAEPSNTINSSSGIFEVKSEPKPYEGLFENIDNVEKHYQFMDSHRENINPYESRPLNISEKRRLMFNSQENEEQKPSESPRSMQCNRNEFKKRRLSDCSSRQPHSEYSSSRYSTEVQEYGDSDNDNYDGTSIPSQSFNLSNSLPIQSTSTPNSCNKRFNAQLTKSAERFKSVSHPTPTYKGYQLLGDSQMVRFSKQVNPYTTGYSRQIGYCVSGQTIEELEKRLLSKEFPLHNKVILMIGTNNLTRNRDITSMKLHFDNIINYLLPLTETIVMLTVPPVPKFENGSRHLNLLRQYNQHIISKSNGRNVFVVDLAPAFMTYDNKILKEYFEKTLGGREEKIDLVHLNRKGFKLLKFYLHFLYFDDI